ncbi:hypothetical protein [Rugamonas apoptosis]|uniref:Type IV pilus assembly protein PilN n=1 Tax=Rugamonas apoptosis TaxID=2758570 RepID=A0A7W2IMW0_9BURK|nr:hypothetical protein [Rugamonas apoptosis]MBA5689971.1 hypothetical protein [Rugamonas apoptosis]
MDQLSAYLKPRNRHARSMMGMSVVTLGTSLWLAWQAHGLYIEAAATDERAQRLRLLAAATPVAAAPTRAEQEEQKRWAALQTERALSWTPLFLALESIGNPDIELLELHPDKVSGQVLLRGEARNEEALTDFLEAMSAQSMFVRAHLTHRKAKKRGELVTIAFEAKAMLSPSVHGKAP